MAIDPGVIFTIPVRPDRVDDFERWVHAVLEPAAEQSSRMPPFRLYRAGPGRGGAVLFVVVGEGVDADRFELQPLFDEVYGEERGRAEAEAFAGMLADEQVLWVLTPLV